MTELNRWSVSAAGNTQAAPHGWPEGMNPSDVNDTARETHAAVRRWQRDISGELTATFAAQVYTLTPERGTTSGELGGLYAFIADAANTGTAQLNVNAIGAKDIRKAGTEHLVADDIGAKQIVQVAYDPTNDIFQMVSPARTGMQTAYELLVKAATDTTGGTASTWETVTYDSEVVDASNTFASNKWTPGVVGRYFVHANALVTAVGNTNLPDGDLAGVRVGVFLSGGSVVDVISSESTIGGAGKPQHSVAGILQIQNVDDYIAVQARATSSNWEVVTGGSCWFGGWRVT